MDILPFIPATNASQLIIFLIAGVALLLASITDLKTREVPDTLNYCLILVGISFNALLAIISSDWRFLLNSALGLGVGFGIGWIMFYAGQWGGGDSKMLMGLGALLGIPFAWQSSFLLSLLLNILLAGAVYGLLWSLFLGIKNRKRFAASFNKLAKKGLHRTLRYVMWVLFLAAILIFFIPFENPIYKLFALLILIIVPLLYYAFLFTKAMENSSMLILQPISKLTEGDWIAKDVVVKGKYLCGPKDLGISKAQIRTLKSYEKKNLIAKVLVKQGIPFIPSFLLAFLFTLAWGNPFTFLIAFL